MLRMLKGTINSIIPSLTKLFNLLIETSSIPELWKYARIVPTPKKAMCHHQEILLSSSNFYSLTASGKAHLHIVSNHIYVHYPISDRQWGFSGGKSTSAAYCPSPTTVYNPLIIKLRYTQSFLISARLLFWSYMLITLKIIHDQSLPSHYKMHMDPVPYLAENNM